MSTLTPINGYTQAIEDLPQEAFLGALLFFSITMADVNLTNARRDLAADNLNTDALRKNLRPVDAFRKATKEFEKKFRAINDVRSELMVRAVGEDGEQAYRHLILERASYQQGKKRRVSYEKVGEITFTRGAKDKKTGEYGGHGVEVRRTTDNLSSPLTLEEDQWLTERLVTFEDRYEHLMNYMDSNAVRAFVRGYIYNLGATCVKESGGLYFIAQDHVDEVSRLAKWVNSVGSQFHALPLLNLVEQRDMILEAFEEETVRETERLMAEVAKILKDPNRQIEEKTFDALAMQGTDLGQKVKDYNALLGTRADRAAASIQMLSTQVMSLAGRIKEHKTHVKKAI